MKQLRKETTMYIKEIWRYPVKSMAGEQLSRVRLTPTGLAGDRILQVQDRDGRIITSRTFPALLGLSATLDAGGTPLVNGKPWTDLDIANAVQQIVGSGASLVRDESVDRFDVLPLLVATDGAIAAFGRDRRRLRPNIVIGGVDGLAEREWEGSQLVIGDAVIQIHDLRGRCVMTTFDPDTLAQDRNVLRDIVKRFGGTLALNCDVTRIGEIQLGQEVTLVPQSAGLRAAK
jgi:uncharacterized protein